MNSRIGQTYWFLLSFIFIAATSLSALPLGIPAPDFGLTEAHTMYTEATFDFGSGPQPYPDAGNGPYTHYVDMNASNATDDDNDFGTPARPRESIPADLPAGSVVELHGGPYNFRNLHDKLAVYGNGTVDAPIFIRCVSTENRAVIGKDMLIFGSYIIVENLQFSMAKISIRQYLEEDVHHIVLRNLIMAGDGQVEANNAAIGVGGWDDHQESTIENVVIINNVMHSYGDWQASEENDVSGICVSGYEVFNTWVLYNEIYYMGGDAIRTGNNDGWTPAYTSRFAYIGGNDFHHNRENAVDLKVMADVIVSQNKMHDYFPTDSDPGAALVCHYEPVNQWVIGNEIYNAYDAIVCSGVERLYVVGNILRDCTYGVRFWGEGEIHIIGNTITRVENGIYNMGGNDAPHPIIDNIITDITDPDGYHIHYDATGLARNSIMEHNLLYQGNGGLRIRWGSERYTTVQSFQRESGKGAGCIEADPLFVDAANNDFRLQATGDAFSPAIDAGIVPDVYEVFQSLSGINVLTDLDGVARPYGLSLDIGAFESEAMATVSTPRMASGNRQRLEFATIRQGSGSAIRIAGTTGSVRKLTLRIDDLRGRCLQLSELNAGSAHSLIPVNSTSRGCVIATVTADHADGTRQVVRQNLLLAH